jgi:hypothetical protein
LLLYPGAPRELEEEGAGMVSFRKMVVSGVVLVAAVTPVALADSGAGIPANVQADITKTQNDVKALHDTVVADAAKVQSDVQSLQGTTDCRQAARTLKADWQQLRGDRRSGNVLVRRDLKQLRIDVRAARQAGQAAGTKELVQAMHSANKQLRTDVRQSAQSARAAVKGLRESLRGSCRTAAQSPDAQQTA